MRLFGSIAGAVTGAVGGEAARCCRNEGVPYRPGTTVGLSGLQQAFQRMLVGTPDHRGRGGERRRAGVVPVLKQLARPRRHERAHHASTRRSRTRPTTPLGSLPDSGGHRRGRAVHRPGAGRGRSTTSAACPRSSPWPAATSPARRSRSCRPPALLETGLRPSAPIPCKASNPVGGQSFTNDPPEPDLGTQPAVPHRLRERLRHRLRRAVAAADRQGAAAAPRPVRPGTRPGSFRSPRSPGPCARPTGQAELAEDSIGDGSVEVSPLDMAIAAAVVQSGTWHPPSLVTGPPDPGLTARRARSAARSSAPCAR